MNELESEQSRLIEALKTELTSILNRLDNFGTNPLLRVPTEVELRQAIFFINLGAYRTLGLTFKPLPELMQMYADIAARGEQP